MAKRGLYFLLNKKEDFVRGTGEGVDCSSGGITLGAEQKTGLYRTRVFDSGERGMQWHRLLMQGSFGAGTVTAAVYAAETRGELLGMSAKRAQYRDPADVLLDGVTGRYLQLELSFVRKKEGDMTVDRVMICFPRRTWLSYLPEIYGEDEKSASFLGRYLGIFQSLYEDMTERIERIPERFTPDTRDEGVLRELADWLGIENRELWNTAQLRYLVKNAARLSGIRGTAAYVKELIRLATGKTAYIVEYCHISAFFDGGETEKRLKRLYASQPYEFALLFDGGGQSEAQELGLVGRIVEMGKPAYMECRIVALTPYIFLDRHSYLGINSVLGRYQTLCLDGKCAIPFSVIAGEDEREKSEIFSI